MSRMNTIRRASIAFAVAGLLLASPGITRADEQTVQNDVYPTFGAGLEADFGAGEQGGVRLTSPCDGSIVALQVGWLSQSGTTGFSLERNIWVYADAGSFPTPGAVLLQLEAPVLNDGALNEFRYIDENNTIPISIPVTTGQSFFVTLEFENPTNLQGGTASLLHDNNVCSPSSNVLYGNFGLGNGWWDLCNLGGLGIGISGNLVIRAVIDCQEPTGACCDADAFCTDGVNEADCQDPGMTFYVGQDCTEVTCPTPVGACCRQGGCLQNVEQATCEGPLGGVYAGNGTDCTDQVCVAGACCLPDGSCQLIFEVQCDAIGGVFDTPGSTCTPNPCPQPIGACCFDTFCLAGQTESDCTGSGGDWVGPMTDCGPPNPCEPDPCDSLTFTPGDVNDDGVLDGRDVTAFVDVYLLVDPPASVAFCAANVCPDDGGLTAADLTAFIECLLAGGTCDNPTCP